MRSRSVAVSITRQKWSTFVPVALAREQVDDRVRVDAHRREQHLAAPPLVDQFTFEPELVAVERERRSTSATLTTT